MAPPEEIARAVAAALELARRDRSRILRHDPITVRRLLAREAMKALRED